MILNRVLWIFIFLNISNFAYTQGDANLLLQYQKGPDINRYRKWNFDINFKAVNIGPEGDAAIPKIGYAFGGNIQYKYSKSIGFSTGVGFLSVNYQYDLKENRTYDNISYLSFPLAIRVFPTERTHFETGLLYHYVIEAKNSEIVNQKELTKNYNDNIFKNVFGWLFAVQYNIWKKFHLSLEYRFFKNSTLTNNLQKNNFNGFLLGIHFLILSPNRKAT